MNRGAFLESYRESCRQTESANAGAPAMESGPAGAVAMLACTNEQGSFAFPLHRLEEAELDGGGLLLVFPGAAVLVTGPEKTLAAGFAALLAGRLRHVRAGKAFAWQSLGKTGGSSPPKYFSPWRKKRY